MNTGVAKVGSNDSNVTVLFKRERIMFNTINAPEVNRIDGLKFEDEV